MGSPPEEFIKYLNDTIQIKDRRVVLESLFDNNYFNTIIDEFFFIYDKKIIPVYDETTGHLKEFKLLDKYTPGNT